METKTTTEVAVAQRVNNFGEDMLTGKNIHA